MPKSALWYAILCVALWTLPAEAHGVRGYSEKDAGIRVTAEYDDGEPMQYAAVEVTAPDGGPMFQTGRTDRNGIFMFAPDQPGRWRVVINDGMGHRLVVGRSIDPADNPAGKTVPAREPVGQGFSRVQGVVTGLSILFGLCGVLYGWKARRRRQHFENKG